VSAKISRQPRRPRPFFRSANSCWYVQFGAKQINLGRDRATAWGKYDQLMAGRQEATAVSPVVIILDQYLAWCFENRGESTYRWYKHLLSDFGRYIGKRLLVNQLKPFHVTQWLATHSKWNDTTQHDAVGAVKRAINWNIRQGYINQSPTNGIERPASKRREVTIEPDQWQQILNEVRDRAFLDYLEILWETGCRPQEARLLEARHCDPNGRRWIYPASESKTKKFPRVVYLNDNAFKITARLLKENRHGHIFRNSKGQPWTSNGIRCRFRRLQTKLRFPGLCAYAIRHTFATEALKNGVDPVTLATLMGHSDVTMLARTYQHLAKHPAFLLEAAGRAKGPSALDQPA
jgi:integrase